MIESRIASSDLTTFEPILSKNLAAGGSYDSFVTEGLEILIDAMENRLEKRGQDLSKLCTRLNFTLDADGVEDTVGRRRLVYQLSAAASNSFELYGSDDDDTYTLINTYTIATTTLTSVKLQTTYKYYKVVRKTGTTSFTYLYLVETSFEQAHKYISLSLAFRSLSRLNNADYYEMKADKYYEMFNLTLNNIHFSFDKDEDEEIDNDDELYKTNSVNYKL